MNILVDTSVWSLGLRRAHRDLNPVERAIFFEWHDILKRGDACLIGPILQEVLSGISNPKLVQDLALQLMTVTQIRTTQSTWMLAAEFYNLCRAAGIVPEAIDMSICAAASESGIPIFTTDPDFTRYVKILPISHHSVA